MQTAEPLIYSYKKQLCGFDSMPGTKALVSPSLDKERSYNQTRLLAYILHRSILRQMEIGRMAVHTKWAMLSSLVSMQVNFNM